MSPALGAGIPTIVVSSQKRISEYLMNVQMGDYLIEIEKCSEDPTVVSNMLIQVFENLYNFKTRVGKARKIQNDLARNIFEKVLEQL